MVEPVSAVHAAAVEYNGLAADAGVADALFCLGVRYATGIGVPEDQAAAVDYFRRVAVAGDVRALFNLGLCYANSIDVADDKVVAVYCFRRAANTGIAVALFAFFGGDLLPERHWRPRGRGGGGRLLPACGRCRAS
jgi:TPR repeat protein